MLSPRWMKLWRDLRAARGRLAMMTIAIAASIVGVGAIFSAYTILTREVTRNYMGTNPASAFVEVDKVDDALVAAVKQQPGIAEAEATNWVMARVEVRSNEWLSLLLFVVPDYNTLRLDRFLPEAGAWPPPAQTLLVEREALKLINAKVGDVLSVQTPNGPKQKIVISGSVHDPGLAPAWQEEMVYGYLTPATLAWLGESDTLHILKVSVKDQSLNLAAIDAQVSALSAWLKAQGHTVGEIRIPPPGMHPHQGQMNAMLLVRLTFSLMALLLSGILTANIISGLLAQQIRQIGIMKAIGARSAQIAGLYLALVAVLGAVAAVMGLPLGVAAGRWLAGAVAELLNLRLYSLEVPAWVYLVLVLVGVLVPLLVAIVPIQRTAGTTVREILSDYGTSSNEFGGRGFDGALSRLRTTSNTFALALRNTFRRRGRLVLTLGLLSAAGAMFMTGLNVDAGWRQFLAEGVAIRRYDLEVRLTNPQSQAAVWAAVAGLPGVQKVEAWNIAPAAVYRADGLDVVHTYPDGGHGSFVLRSAPPESQMLVSPMLSGRWLQAGDADGVVLNQLAAALFPDARPGDTVRLMINGRPATFRLVGVVKQIMTQAAAYVTPDTFASAAGLPAASTNAIRLVLAAPSNAAVTALTGQVGSALAAQGIGVKVFMPRTLLEGASDAHTYIFIFSLVAMAVIMAVVGVLGLAASMGISVIERTREFGVMRAIGAPGRTVLHTVVGESVFIGVLSWVLAVPLSLLPSWLVGYLMGSIFSRVPVNLVISPLALGIWLLVVGVGAALASAYPARQAAQLTVRETLAYV